LNGPNLGEAYTSETQLLEEIRKEFQFEDISRLSNEQE
jgi:hypothetical protein